VSGGRLSFGRVSFSARFPSKVTREPQSFSILANDDSQPSAPFNAVSNNSTGMSWQRIGLSPPEAVTDATESYLESQDLLGEWLAECCEFGANAWEATTSLFDSWKQWAEDRDEWVGSVKTLSQRLEDRGGFTKRRNKQQTTMGFAGLKLKPRNVFQQLGAKQKRAG
jgi:hypothetical protein